MNYIADPHSCARPEQARITHLHLEAEIDFTEKCLKGRVVLHIDKTAECEELWLDTYRLNIYKAALDESNTETFFELGPHDKHMGSALKINILPDTQIVTVYYHTTEDAKALQWIDAALTTGGQQPLLFSQSEPNLARSWVPLQDSPGIRFTYSANLTVPEGILPLMSARNPTERNADNFYHFQMEHPVPAYLMAIAAGDFAFRPVGNRTGVYAEPAMLEKAAWEFADMEKMMEAAEALYGPYRWERYDVLVLPASFPFGGMENPMLTFATPTILSGDRSLVSLVAHELAHSWSGNLVTNATWNDFWLNEGFTVYFERRIMEALEGKSYADMLEVLGYQDLKRTVEELGADSPATHLKLDLAGKDPDDGMNQIAYEKGYFLLRRIEDIVGREKWDQFLRSYFEDFAFRQIDTESWLAYIKQRLFAVDPRAWEKLNAEEWIYGPGIPENIHVVAAARFAAVDTELARFPGAFPSTGTTAHWSTHEWLHYLRGLSGKAKAEDLARLDAALHVSRSENREIQFAWYQLAIAAGYEPAFDAMRRFLGEVGRGKFVTPTYLALKKAGYDTLAADIYKEKRGGYHPVVAARMDNLIEA